MKAFALRWVVAMGLLEAASPVHAEQAACEAEPMPADTLTDRAGTLSRYEQLPQECLKAMVMRCTAEADQQLLDPGSAAVCSISYEALLRRGFSGDFNALLAWWRTRPVGQTSVN